MKSASSSGSRSASKLWSRRAAVGSPAAADAAVAAAVAADARRASASALTRKSVGASSSVVPGSAGVNAASGSGSTSARKSTACSVCVRSMASPSARPALEHRDSDSGLPG